ncbi:RNA polymerase sigma factor [Enterococcus sp. LJL99]
MLDNVLLVKQAQRGNHEAFIQLIQSYEKVLYNMAYRFLHNEQDVADVLQETVLSAYQNIEKVKKPQYFNTWIGKILINQCKKMIEVKEKEESKILRSVKENIIFEQFSINQMVKTMDSIYQIPIVLYYYVGFSVKEISEILCEPVGTIKSRLFRGRELLKREYDYFEGDEK